MFFCQYLLMNYLGFFTSSTFTDMLMERNTLMEWVYPKIKEYCREKHGLEFQVPYAIITCVYFFVNCLFTFLSAVCLLFISCSFTFLSAVCLLFYQLFVYFFISCLFTSSIKGSGHEMWCL